LTCFRIEESTRNTANQAVWNPQTTTVHRTLRRIKGSTLEFKLFASNLTSIMGQKQTTLNVQGIIALMETHAKTMTSSDVRVDLIQAMKQSSEESIDLVPNLLNDMLVLMMAVLIIALTIITYLQMQSLKEVVKRLEREDQNLRQKVNNENFSRLTRKREEIV